MSQTQQFHLMLHNVDWTAIVAKIEVCARQDEHERLAKKFNAFNPFSEAIVIYPVLQLSISEYGRKTYGTLWEIKENGKQVRFPWAPKLQMEFNF